MACVAADLSSAYPNITITQRISVIYVTLSIEQLCDLNFFRSGCCIHAFVTVTRGHEVGWNRGTFSRGEMGDESEANHITRHQRSDERPNGESLRIGLEILRNQQLVNPVASFESIRVQLLRRKLVCLLTKKPLRSGGGFRFFDQDWRLLFQDDKPFHI